MNEGFVAVIVAVPEEHFRDDDDICLGAARFVCSKLEPALREAGHVIPEWLRGGCDEDWGVYLESHLGSERFDYLICFFPDSRTDKMLVQYGRKPSGLRAVFGKTAPIDPGHPIHSTMRAFAAAFTWHRQLDRAELDRVY